MPSASPADGARPSLKGYVELMPEEQSSLIEGYPDPGAASTTAARLLAGRALIAAGFCLCGALAVGASDMLLRPGAHSLQGAASPQVAWSGLTGSLQVEAQVFQGPGKCGSADEDTEYVLWGAQWGMSMDHVPSAEMCCALCHGVPQCKSWTWIKDAGLDECPSQCWLKGRTPDTKEPKAGYVSGVPPPRPKLPPSGDVSARVAKARYRGPLTDASQFCSKTEVDIDYQSGQLLFTVDHMWSAAQCCHECYSVPQCRAWTWGKFRADDNQNSVCYLKSAAPDHPSQKQKSPGAVSGIPETRRWDRAFTMEDLEAVKVEKEGSAFCFSLMLPKSYEEELLKTQYALGASIFACDEWAVYSNQSITVAPGLRTAIVESDLQCPRGGDSYTALNTWIFIAVWRKVIDDRRFLYHDWTVKVDPDSVFFPSRLAVVLRDHKQAGYVNNCKFGLHGPIEVLSRRGLGALAADYAASFDGKSPSRCVAELNFGEWGEDFWLDACLSKVLQVRAEMDERLMCEAHCDCPDWFWCKDGSSRVSFHPFKRSDLYRQCMANAIDEAQLS